MTARILVVSPHPDDESLGCGGAIVDHRWKGDEVRVVFLTSGEAGGHGRSPEEVRKVREKEAWLAAGVLGVAEQEFWREPDGALRATQALARRLADRILDWRPTRVYAPHPGEDHADHRAAARLAQMAVGLLAADVRPEVLGFEVWTPLGHLDEILDISTAVLTKLQAIRCYKSQGAHLRFDVAFEGLARYRGEMHCWPPSAPPRGRVFAEVFQRLLP